MLPRLMSLELQGYKTFANRTLFEFPGMITAVVGPNGSGKSNIADALRWVLGEQSYSILRGKKTEDMIFAGTEQRPRAGMASATITFDNSDGWLPVDFVEVAITRRAFRDGQNEYLLNGQRVRLREISELLAQCGLAERTYTIIGQGLVDAALALKPEERRRLFEEAAGIGLYRSRKEEALHRLEATQRNLVRVQDILAEIEPRLQSLEKQARRVQEYERIKADLRILLREWYGYHWYHAQRELNRVLELLRTHGNRLEQARQRQEETANELAATRSQIQEIRGQLNELYAQSSQENNQLQLVSRDLAITGERQKSLVDTQRSLESDLVRAEEESRVYESNLKTAVEEKELLSIELQNANNQVQSSRQALQERWKERETAEKLIREVRGLVVSSETRQVQLRARQQEINQRLEGLTTTQQKFSRDIANSELQLKKAQDRLFETDHTRQESEAALYDANLALRVDQKKIAESETEKKRLLDQRLQLESEAARLTVQIHALEQAEESYTGYTEGARHLLQAVKQGRLRGEYRTLSSLVDVPQEYEVAIAAAIGEYLDLILLSGDEDPENVLRFIERDAKGRVALLPLEWAAPDEPVEIPEDEDCFGLAIDLIQNELELANVVKVFLSNVLVVRNRTAAHRILRDMPARTRAVTLRGELFSGNGPVLAGMPGRTGTIGRKRQTRELTISLDKLNKQNEEKSLELSNLEQRLMQLRSDEAEKNKEIRQISERVDKDRKNHQSAQLALEQIQRQFQWQTAQQNDLVKQAMKSQNELAQTAKELEGVESRLADARSRVRQLSADLSRLPMEDLLSQVAHWETACAVCARALQDAEKRSIERQQTLEANNQQRNRLQARLAETARTTGEQVAKKNNLQQAERELTDQIHALQAKIDPLAAELATIEKEYDNQQAVETAAQQALTVSERYYTQALLDHTRQREAMESLRRRIEEDMGLVALEYEANVSGPTPLPFDGLVDQFPLVTELASTIDESINRQRAQLRRIGAINLDAQSEYNSVLERYRFLTDQVADLRKADASLREVIAELDGLMKRDFTKTFNAVAVEFRQMFTRLFGGGSAHLVLFDEENPQDSGIEIEARLPGRREQGLALLSGGERSLTATALVFALLKVSPTPFCVMDEVDAMLDEANVGRFVGLLRELSLETQFIVITHNRNTVQSADVIYGVTMGRDSISQLISLKLDEISEEMVV